MGWPPQVTPLPGVWAAVSRARSAGLVAWRLIHASAQPLWQGTSLTGDRQQVSPSHSTHGAGGPVAACRQSRTTPPGVVLVAWDMPRSPVLRGRNWSGWPGRGMAVPQARHYLWSGGGDLPDQGERPVLERLGPDQRPVEPGLPRPGVTHVVEVLPRGLDQAVSGTCHLFGGFGFEDQPKGLPGLVDVAGHTVGDQPGRGHGDELGDEQLPLPRANGD